MKVSGLKIAALMLAATPSAAYAGAFAAGEGSINWGTGRFAAIDSMYFCEASFGPVPHMFPCWSRRYTM